MLGSFPKCKGYGWFGRIKADSELPVDFVVYREQVSIEIHRKVVGVEHYLVQLLKLMKVLGIDGFDIVPEWAKPILQFVVQ